MSVLVSGLSSIGPTGPDRSNRWSLLAELLSSWLELHRSNRSGSVQPVEPDDRTPISLARAPSVQPVRIGPTGGTRWQNSHLPGSSATGPTGPDRSNRWNPEQCPTASFSAPPIYTPPHPLELQLLFLLLHFQNPSLSFHSIQPHSLLELDPSNPLSENCL
jgi:hypothetical protein